MEPFVSIVIPTYNIKSMLELNLYSLFNQTYSQNRYEVIVVDDCSTDGTTAMCHSLSTPYAIKVLNTDKNIGRARVRNFGVSAAEGDIIIFCDGDTIQPPVFIENHVKQHLIKDNLVLSSLPRYFALCFSHYFDDFSQWQKKTLLSLDPDVITKVSGNARLIEPMTVLSDFEQIERLCYLPGWFAEYSEVIEYFDNFASSPTSWFCLTTRNVSTSKKLFLESGGFDENFRYWGSEDWEMGYRLKSMGAYCDCQKEVMNYHQEHPPTRGNSGKQNYIYFCSKYKSPDLYLLENIDWRSLFIFEGESNERCWSLLFYNKLISQYLDIRDKPAYGEFVELFRALVYSDFRRRFLEEKPDFFNYRETIRKIKAYKALLSDYKELACGFRELLEAHTSKEVINKHRNRKPRPPRKRRRKIYTNNVS